MKGRRSPTAGERESPPARDLAPSTGAVASGMYTEPDRVRVGLNTIAEELGRLLARSLLADRRKGFSLPELLIGATLMAVVARVVWRWFSGS